MDNEYGHDLEYEDEDEDAKPRGVDPADLGIYLIRITHPDGTSYVTQAIRIQSAGGFTVHLAC